MRKQTRRLRQAGHRLAPRGDRRLAVLCADPGQIVAVGRDPGENGGVPIVRIERQQFTHEDRRGPAIHQQMMAGDHEPMIEGSETDQGKPEQRRQGDVEPSGAIVRQDRCESLVACTFIEG